MTTNPQYPFLLNARLHLSWLREQGKSAWLRFCGRNRQLLRLILTVRPHCITSVKLADVEEVGSIVAFVASPQASWLIDES
jgi:hypothetical protein